MIFLKSFRHFTCTDMDVHSRLFSDTAFPLRACSTCTQYDHTVHTAECRHTAQCNRTAQHSHTVEYSRTIEYSSTAEHCHTTEHSCTTEHDHTVVYNTTRQYSSAACHHEHLHDVDPGLVILKPSFLLATIQLFFTIVSDDLRFICLWHFANKTGPFPPTPL